MDTEHPLVFGGEPEEVARRMNGPELELEHVARKVIAALRPLEPAHRARVLRAVTTLLGLD